MHAGVQKKLPNFFITQRNGTGVAPRLLHGALEVPMSNLAGQFNDCVLDETDLLQIELRIARRADEIAQRCSAGLDRVDDRYCWLEAEREVFSTVGELVG
jgi:hypothetical protein